MKLEEPPVDGETKFESVEEQELVEGIQSLGIVEKSLVDKDGQSPPESLDIHLPPAVDFPTDGDGSLTIKSDTEDDDVCTDGKICRKVSLTAKSHCVTILHDIEQYAERKEIPVPETIDCNGSVDLISRGPIATAYSVDRHRPYVAPYHDRSCSPPLNDRRRSSGGSVQVLSRGMIRDLSLIGETNQRQNECSPNRQQYMHKNGGALQEVTPTLFIAPSSISYLPPSSPENSLSPSPPNGSMSISSPAPSPSSYSDALSISDLESMNGSSVHSPRMFKLPEDEDFSMHAYNDSSVSQDFFEDQQHVEGVLNDILDMDEQYKNKNPNGGDKYKETISDILRLIDCGNLQESSSVDVVCPPVLEVANGNLENDNNYFDSFSTSTLNGVVNGNGNNMQAIQPVNSAPLTWIALVPTSVNDKSKTQRPILPKPSPSPQRVTNGHPLTIDAKELREAILSVHPHQKRIHFHCNITKCSDEDLNQDSDGDTKLHIAIANKNEVATVFLIDRFTSSASLSLDVANNKKETPLLCAAVTNQKSIVEYLLAKGADPNVQCPGNLGTVLHYAAQRGDNYLGIVKSLCRDARIQLNAYDTLGRTPLLAAVETHGRGGINSTSIARHLLQMGASMGHENRRSGKNALHVAVEMGALDILKVLCKECENICDVVNKANFDENTPLHFAATMSVISEKGQIEFVRLLLDSGACPRMTNRQHKTPADMVEKDRRLVRKLLLSSRRGSK